MNPKYNQKSCPRRQQAIKDPMNDINANWARQQAIPNAIKSINSDINDTLMKGKFELYHHSVLPDEVINHFRNLGYNVINNGNMVIFNFVHLIDSDKKRKSSNDV